MLAIVTRPAKALGNAVAVLTGVRHAHKKVVSSKTHMQDSAGKRLGAKKYENHEVKIGQILYRQRGTKWYPGFNVGIGKDHTLFALQPGFVKYYLDPFHPKRKFIGVALKKEDTLPYPHFEPTQRRLGRAVLQGKHADLELDYLPRKQTLLKPKIIESLNQRQSVRLSKLESFKSFLKPLGLVSEADLTVAAQRLVKIDGYMRGGKSDSDSKLYTTHNFVYDTNLAIKRNELSSEEGLKIIENYKNVAQTLDSAIILDARLNPLQSTVEQLQALKQSSLDELKANPNPKTLKEILNRPCFTKDEQCLLQKKYGKKKTIQIQKMNVHTRTLENVSIQV